MYSESISLYSVMNIRSQSHSVIRKKSDQKKAWEIMVLFYGTFEILDFSVYNGEL